MKHVRVVGLVSGGLLLISAALLLALTPRARAAGQLLPLAQTPSVAIDPLTPGTAIICTVNVTTTDAIPNNQSADTAATIANYSGLALVGYSAPTNQAEVQPDWFVLGNATTGYTYNFEASPDGSGNYNLGMDIYSGSPSNLVLVTSDFNTGDGNSAKIVTGFSSFGPYYIKIYQISNYCSGGTYTLRFSSTPPTLTPSLTPTPTPTPTPTKTITPTPGPFACTTGSDKFEPNNDYDTATTIGLGVTYIDLNFVECGQSDGSWDNDYFKVRVKPGMLVTCRTFDLKTGTDTNLILYDVNMNGINGSDDINRAIGDLSSSVTYYVTYEGWLYSLVGEGFHRPQSEQLAAGYSFQCIIGTQSTPTEAPTPTEVPGQPTRTPVPTIPPTPTITLTPSPTLSPTPPFIRIVPLPTITPAGLPAKSIPVSLQVYYDIDSNNKSDPGEGVVGVSARVFDLTNGNLLAQGLTDQTGRVSFTVSAISAVQLVVSYFNFSTIILPASGGSAVIRISPHELPGSIP